jgi:hypothetical protein
MDLIVCDWETYYDDKYSLIKIPTEEYIRSELFEAIGLSVKVNDGEPDWISGGHNEIKKYLHATYDWETSAVLAHNNLFDSAINSWLYDIHPRLLLDTLCMARALHGVEVRGSLAKLAAMYGLGEKGTEVVDAKGKRLADFTEAELSDYGDYCINDTDLCYELFNIFVPIFPKHEIRVIDMTLRMFTEPVLELDVDKIKAHVKQIKKKKEAILESCGITRPQLMSNPQFALVLEEHGVEVPMKVSPTTGKQTFAFAKKDEGFKALLAHSNKEVRELASARIEVKSTLEETRAERFIGISNRGLLPVPIKYYAAHTGRFGGMDKINLQNLPSRGDNGKVLKSCIVAPEGYTLIEADLAQIEARVLAWLAGQDNLVQAFKEDKDVYKMMASEIYAVTVEEVSKPQRFVGKQTILGCIAKGTPVLCEAGWKPIEEVTTKDKLWDGVEWVCHQGLVKKGLKETVSLCGSWLTPDHKILCGTKWVETGLVVQDENTLSQALDTGAENLPLQGMSEVFVVESKPSLLHVGVAAVSTQLTNTTSRRSKALGVISVLKNLLLPLGKCTGGIQKLCLMTSIGHGYSTDSVPLLAGATKSQTAPINTTGVGVLPCTNNGEITEGLFSPTYKPLRDGTILVWRWIGQITIKGTHRAISGLLHAVKTWLTGGTLAPYRRRLKTYDLAYAGPRNRFTIKTNRGPVIAHNCGYGMGAPTFKAQLLTHGVEISDAESAKVIRVYRSSNTEITRLWKEGQNVLMGMHQGDRYALGKQGVLSIVPDSNAIKLPSGLLMRYEDLQVTDGDRGPQFSYQTRKGRVNIYGGKVIENVCQGIARCIITHQMVLISKRYRSLLTVHDSSISCVLDEELDEAAAYVDDCMRMIPDWAEGLPVRGDIDVGKNYGSTKKWMGGE